MENKMKSLVQSFVEHMDNVNVSNDIPDIEYSDYYDGEDDCYYDDEGVRYVRHDNDNGKFEPERPVDKNGFWKCTSLTDYDTDNPDGQTPQQKYLEYHQSLHDKCYDLTKRKQRDYCSLNSDDPLSVFENFMSPEHDNITDCLTVLRCRLSEKYKRLNVCLNKNESEIEFETIDDTIEDIINMITLISYYRSLKTTD